MEEAAGDGTRRPSAARVALLTFVGAEIAAAVMYIVNGRKVWFFGVFGDEWDFLAGRRATIPDLLMRHGDHLVALPALTFRVLYTAFGLRSYEPYQLCSIGLHLAAAALLRVVMRRAGVDPWIATAAAGAFALFGAGSQDILIAFQITFSGALVFGLVQLLLVDHAGPIDRRDGLALLAGLGALLCSDVSLVIIAAAGVAALLRGRWRAALLQVVPLGVVYAAWEVGYGRSARTNTDLSRIATSVRTTIGGTFDALAQVPFLGWVLVALLVAGLVVAWQRARDAGTLATLAAPAALGLAAILFALMLALTRFGLGGRFAESSRYLHVVAALVLPGLAVAADALARRWRVLTPIVLLLLLVGVPGNIAKTGRNVGPAARYAAQRRVITALPILPEARTAPPSLHPTPSFAAEVTVGWLLGAVHDHRIPTTRPTTRRDRATDRLRLSLEQ